VTSTSYIVHDDLPADVEQELKRLWTDNLPVRGSVADKFQWLYRESHQPTDTVFTLRANDAVVGSVGLLNRTFRIGERNVRVGLLSDLAVDREHRSLLPALRLVRRAREYALANRAFIYGFPNKHARGLFKRARYRELGSVVRYARILRHAHYARRGSETDRVPRMVATAIKNPVVARVVGAVADLGRLTMAAGQGARAIAKFRLEWLDAADERFDVLWERARAEYPVVAERTAAFLRWRYPARAGCRLAALVDRGSNDLRAYALVQQDDGDVAHLRDMFGHLGDLGSLVDLLLPSLYRQRARSVSIHYLGNPRVVDVLTSRGFVPRETERTISIGAASALDGQAEFLESVDHWHVTDLDEDV